MILGRMFVISGMMFMNFVRDSHDLGEDSVDLGLDFCDFGQEVCDFRQDSGD